MTSFPDEVKNVLPVAPAGRTIPGPGRLQHPAPSRAGDRRGPTPSVSDPDPNDPWAKHYAEHGHDRPPLRKVAGVRPETTKKTGWEVQPQIEIVTAADRARQQAELEAKRLHDVMNLLSLLGVAIGIVLLLAVLFEAGNRLGNALPPSGRLAEQSREFAAQALRQLDTAACPLELDSARAVLVVKPNARRASYNLLATFRLRADLYAPAASSGAQAYLQMQQSVAEARAEVVQYHLSNAAPELPLLLARSHRAGERVTVQTALEAERFGWHWQLHAPAARPLRPDREITGGTLAAYTGTPVLRFDTPEGRQAMREKIAEGRRFVLEVKAELERQGVRTGPDS